MYRKNLGSDLFILTDVFLIIWLIIITCGRGGAMDENYDFLIRYRFQPVFWNIRPSDYYFEWSGSFMYDRLVEVPLYLSSSKKKDYTVARENWPQAITRAQRNSNQPRKLITPLDSPPSPLNYDLIKRYRIKQSINFMGPDYSSGGGGEHHDTGCAVFSCLLKNLIDRKISGFFRSYTNKQSENQSRINVGKRVFLTSKFLHCEFSGDNFAFIGR